MAYIGNFLLTRLAQNLDLSSTSMTVTSGDGAKFGAEMIRLYGAEMFPYYLIIRSQAYGQAVLDPNREIVQVTARDEDTFTIVRGTRGTTAVAHYSGDYVQLSLQADDLIFPETTVRRLDPNLCLYLPFEEGTGTKTKDLSGWGNHGTLVNGPTWTNGRVGKCLSFDGSDDRVDCGQNALPTGNSPFTQEAWVKPNTMGTENDHSNIICWGNDANNQKNGLALANYAGVYKILHWFYNNDNGWTVPNLVGAWHHVVVTYNGTSLTAYLDGASLGSQNPPSTPKVALTNAVVGYYANANNAFNGLIDEVRIYNRALSASEVQDHYLNP